MMLFWVFYFLFLWPLSAVGTKLIYVVYTYGTSYFYVSRTNPLHPQGCHEVVKKLVAEGAGLEPWYIPDWGFLKYVIF